MRFVWRQRREPPGVDLKVLARTIERQSRGMLKRRLGDSAPNVVVEFDRDAPFTFDCHLRRERGVIHLTFSANSPDFVRDACAYHAQGFLYYFASGPGQIRKMSANCSDGDRASGATFSPSTFLPGVVAYPDSFFLAYEGYATHRREGHEPVPWDMRSNMILWRGSMNGPGSFVPNIGRALPEQAAQRLLLCFAARGLDQVDCRFINARIAELGGSEYEREGLAGEFVPPLSWAARKFAVDVDGWTNAWPNYFNRMLDGCCVLKVAGRFGYKQWYYDRLKPWEHFVPVAADLSDFAERVEWVRTHDAECQQIARAAREVMLTETFDAVQQRAWHLLEEHGRD